MGKSGNPAKRAAQENAETEPVQRERAAAADEYGTEDFDAFWQERRAKRKPRHTNIMGVTVTLPHALPLQFEMEAKRLERSKSEDDVRRLVGVLFGDDALDAWVANGLDGEQFAVLLAWAPLVIAGQDVTLAEVADALQRVESDDQEDEGTDPH